MSRARSPLRLPLAGAALLGGLLAPAAPLLAQAAPALTTPPVNVLRLSLHPGGLAKSIINLGQWKAHVLWRLGQQIHATHDAKLIALEKELAAQGFGLHRVALPPQEVGETVRLDIVTFTISRVTIDGAGDLVIFVGAGGTDRWWQSVRSQIRHDMPMGSNRPFRSSPSA